MNLGSVVSSRMAPSSSTPLGLLSFPDELLLEILHLIKGTERYCRMKALYGLSLASRRLHRLSNPCLYSIFSFHYGIHYLFLHTISLSPDLGCYVKKVDWSHDPTRRDLYDYESGVGVLKQQFPLQDACNKLGQMAAQGSLIASQLIADLESEHLHLGDLKPLEVLLMFTPNLEELGVCEAYRWDNYIYWFLPILCEPNRFSRLTSASIMGPMRLENILGLLFLPSMRHLSLEEVIEMGQEQDREFQWQTVSKSDLLNPGIFNKRSSNVESLEFHCSYIGPVDILKIIRATPKLKSLFYEQQKHDLSRRHLEPPYEVLAQLLVQQRDLLTSTRIQISHSSEPVVPLMLWENETILFEAVQGSSSLSALYLPYASKQQYYLGPPWDLLPPNLEQLTLDYLRAHEYIEDPADTMELELALEDLVIRKQRGELPKLRALILDNWHPYYGSFPRNISVGQRLEHVGVRFVSSPARVGSSIYTIYDIGWVELQSEPGWVIIEKYRVHEELP